MLLIGVRKKVREKILSYLFSLFSLFSSNSHLDHTTLTSILSSYMSDYELGATSSTLIKLSHEVVELRKRMEEQEIKTKQLEEEMTSKISTLKLNHYEEMDKLKQEISELHLTIAESYNHQQKK